MITDKLVAKIPSAYPGKVVKLHHKNDEMCQVGQPLLDMEVGDEVSVKDEIKKDEHKEAAKAPAPAPEKKKEPVQEKPVEAPKPAPVHDEAAEEKVYTTPAVRMMAKRLKVNLAQVKGTGRRGRVTKEDVLAFVEAGGKPQMTQEQPKIEKKPEAPLIPTRGDKLIKLTGFRKAMVRSMTDALTIPHESIEDVICMDNLRKVRKAYLDSNPGKKLTYLPFFIKAASCALSEFPMFNAFVNVQKGNEGAMSEYIEKAEHNISVAVDSPVGLLVPNLKSVQRKSILQINEEMRYLVERAKKAALTQDDLSNGTFTLSNIGNIGCIIGTPVIFRPQVAIMAIGKNRLLPDIKEVKGVKKIVPKEVSHVCLSADKRVVETADMIRFVNCFRQYLENLELLLLRLK